MRKGSSPRRLLRLMDSNAAISADKLRAAISFNATEAAVWDVLQALFHAEYLLLAEYIECALPLLYSLSRHRQRHYTLKLSTSVE
ncbi:hypothetical protein PR001_g30750 [Phytophthora rubi]|uniref:Uncharacterized protein n=1 Tax=Phytophthora rubi TaxID=129364 RepID=A0A6A3GK31_9STRA|nr:hypothetical protein PR001_g30750 [Phytophthora rubi]